MKREQIVWLAGWLEGEGTFFYSNTPGHAALVVSVGSIDADTIRRAKRFTGLGHITQRTCNAKPFYTWKCNGREAYAVMVMVFPFMGRRRQTQIRTAVTAWKAVPVGSKWKTHCNHGHEYTPENTIRYPSDPNRRRCRKCTRKNSDAE